MKKTITLALLLTSLAAGPLNTLAFFDISSGGAPTITGARNGSVTGSPSVLNNLSVTIDFGEISPVNTNSYVKVVVPIAIRSDKDYKVTATITGGTNINPQALQRSDIGFGMNNMRSMGANSKVCTNSPHIIYSPFNSDPSTSMSILPSGRVGFTSSLNNMSTATLLVSGPVLSRNKTRAADNGYIFDAIFVIAPEFFAVGNTTATITFTIGDGFNAAC